MNLEQATRLLYECKEFNLEGTITYNRHMGEYSFIHQHIFCTDVYDNYSDAVCALEQAKPKPVNITSGQELVRIKSGQRIVVASKAACDIAQYGTEYKDQLVAHEYIARDNKWLMWIVEKKYYKTPEGNPIKDVEYI